MRGKNITPSPLPCSNQYSNIIKKKEYKRIYVNNKGFILSM